MPVPKIGHRRSFVAELKFGTQNSGKERSDAGLSASNLKCSHLMADGNTLDFSAHLPSIVREGAFVGKPQVPTTLERSGHPARRRLTFIGSQSPNQTKKAPFQVPFCLAGGNTLDLLARAAILDKKRAGSTMKCPKKVRQYLKVKII